MSHRIILNTILYLHRKCYFDTVTRLFQDQSLKFHGTFCISNFAEFKGRELTICVEHDSMGSWRLKTRRKKKRQLGVSSDPVSSL